MLLFKLVVTSRTKIHEEWWTYFIHIGSVGQVLENGVEQGSNNRIILDEEGSRGKVLIGGHKQL